jgi:hypothetical protein
MPRPPRAPGSHRPAGAGRPPALTSPAVAARIRQLAAQAEHHRAIAEFHARRTADHQARVDTLPLEVVAALASLLTKPGRTGNHQA